MMVRNSLAIATLVGLSALTSANAAEDFYRGKMVRLVLGSGEASGVDTLGRIAARHLHKHIPGAPTVIAQNMPAPESIAAANYIYNIAAPDGLTLGAGSSGLFSRAISQPNIRFDLDRFKWVANMYSATVLIWMRADFPCATLEALRTCSTPLKFSATARGSTGYGLVPELIKDVMKLNIDIIYGYRTADADLAVERGEAQASGGDTINFLGGRPAQLMREGKVKILLQVAGRKAPELEAFDIPWAMDLIPEDQKGVFQMLNPILDLARPYFAPPDTPEDRVQVLRTAFTRLMDDADFRAEVRRVARIEPTLTQGAGMERQIHSMLDQPPEVKAKVVQLLRSE